MKVLTLPRGVGQDHVYHHLYDVMQSCSKAFSVGEDCFVLSMHPEEYPPQKDFKQISYMSLYSTTCLY